MKSFSKTNFVKVLGATTLATLIATAGVFTFTPINTNAEVLYAHQNEITESTGLISPKEDDPILFTTESGLEIKAGKALSGNLVGFPYFTTNDGTQDYYWVIIGRSLGVFENITLDNLVFGAFCDGDSEWAQNLLTSLGGKTSLTHDVGFQIWINSFLQACIAGVSTNNWTSLPKESVEIPSNCILALSNTAFLSHSFVATTNYQYCTDYPVDSYMQNAYTNNEWGLSVIKSKIKPVSIKTGSAYREGELKYSTQTRYIFSLASSYRSDDSMNFKVKTYLTNSQEACGVVYMLRGYNWNEYKGYQHSCDENGNHSNSFLYASNASITTYARPAFVMSLV